MRHTTPARCAGVDGCRQGWVVATRDGVTVLPVLEQLLADAVHLGIDMPIGLPDEPPREADRAARRLLGARHPTVFPAPPRTVLHARTQSQASAVSRGLHGRGVSIQTFNLLPKIREVDELARSLPLPERDARLVEVHPECSFQSMAGRSLPSKHTREGLSARAALVERHLGITPEAVRGAGMDDVLDAYAALWTTERFASGAHMALPDVPVRDRWGTLMRIVV